MRNEVTFVVPGVLKQAGAAGRLLSVYLVLQHVLQQPVFAVLPICVVQRCPFLPVFADNIIVLYKPYVYLPAECKTTGVPENRSPRSPTACFQLVHFLASPQAAVPGQFTERAQ